MRCLLLIIIVFIIQSSSGWKVGKRLPVSRCHAHRGGGPPNRSRQGQAPPDGGIVPPPASVPQKPKNYAMRTILGQQVMKCREFSLDNRRSFEFIGSFKSEASLPTYPLPEVAFVGRSNVGKSSLLNCISGAHKAIAVVGKQPGRTQSLNLFKCSDDKGDICMFTDLPGYGYAKISKGAKQEISGFVNAYLQRRQTLRITVVIVDPRLEPQASDRAMINFLNDIGNPYAVVATKADKLKKNEQVNAARALRIAYELPATQPILFSSETGQGVREVWSTLKDGMLGQGAFSDEHYQIIGDDHDDDDGRGMGSEDWGMLREGSDGSDDDGDDFR